MAQLADTIDLSTLTDQEAAKVVSKTVVEWTAAITEVHPECNHRDVRMLVDEFTTNALHGDEAVVHFFSLPDGSFLLASDDVEGCDHIDPRCSGHVGSRIITALAGASSYILHQTNDRHYRGFLRIDPHGLATAS